MTRHPSLWFVAALGAGLMIGLSRFLDPGFVALLLTVGLWLRRHESAVVVPAAALAGLLLAEVAHHHDRGSCGTLLPEGLVALTVRLADPSGAGVGRATPVGAGCHGMVEMRFNQPASYPAGVVLAVSGRWLPQARAFRPGGGTLVVRSYQLLATRPTPAERLRTAISATSERLYGRRAPVVDALILGRRAAMDPELREDFARSGLVHLLAISGFHVGLLTSWTILLALACRVRRPRAYLLGGVVAVAYVAFLGWPAPATRAALLGCLVALGVARQRSVAGSAMLAAAALGVMLVDPWAVFDLGAWLSVGSIAGLMAATRWSDRTLGKGWGWRMLAASVGSTLATAPLTAAVIGAVAPIGIVLNFAAIPLAAVAVPGVLATLLAALVAPPLAASLAAGSGLVLALLEELARVGARIPGGHLIFEPGVPAAAPWLLFLGLALWGIRGRATAFTALRRWGWAGAVGIWALAVADAARGATDGHDGLTLHFLDVGQGDAAAVRTPGGRWILVDAGPADQRYDAGRRVVAPFLARQGARRLEAALVSHAHADHLGGLASVLGRVPAGLVLEPGMAAADAGYSGFLDRVAAHGWRWRPARRGEQFTVDGVTFSVLHPDTTWSWWGLDLNENSLVVRVAWGRFAALLTGDAGFPAESLLAGRIGPVDLLKVGHHGSRGSTGEAFLSETRPTVAIISAGRRNRHGHPAPEALERLDAAGVRVYRTDLEGTIRVTVGPGAMTLHGATGAITYPLRH